jgi:hypothetical protein
VLAAYAKSGLTQRAFAREEGIKYSSLVRWLGLSRRGQVVAAKPPIRFAEVKFGARAPGLEIVLPNGVMIRGGDVAQLAAMMKALGR